MYRESTAKQQAQARRSRAAGRAFHSPLRLMRWESAEEEDDDDNEDDEE
jgi:hypothetical protein